MTFGFQETREVFGHDVEEGESIQGFTTPGVSPSTAMVASQDTKLGCNGYHHVRQQLSWVPQLSPFLLRTPIQYFDKHISVAFPLNLF